MPAPDTTHADIPRWSTRQLILMAGTSLVGLALGWIARAQELGVDEATHVVLSQSLASGHYRDEYLVGHPQHAQYPPGMAAWLLLLRTLFGPDLDVVRAVNLLLVAATALLAADALRRLRQPVLGLATFVVIVLNPALLTLAGTVRSETPFIALGAVALWATIAVAPGTWRSPAAAGMAAIGAFLTRSAGISVLGAVVVAATLRRWRVVLPVAGVAVTVAAGWFLYTGNTARRSAGRSYAQDLSLVARGPESFVSHAIAVGHEHIVRTPFAQFSLPAVAGTKIETLLYAAFIVGMSLVGLTVMARRWPAMVANVVLATGLLLVWPWSDARFVTPLVPWIVVAMLAGVAAVSHRYWPSRGDRVVVLVAALFAVAGIVELSAAARRRVACRASADALVDPACNHSETRALAPAARFIRDSLPESAIVATSKNALVHLVSGRLTVPLTAAENAPNDFPIFVPGTAVTHALLTHQAGGDSPWTVGELRKHCALVGLVRSFPNGSILLTLRSRNPGLPDACAALAQFQLDSDRD